VASHCCGRGKGIRSRWTDAPLARTSAVATLPLAKLPNAEAEESSSRNNCTAIDATVNCPCARLDNAFAHVLQGARDDSRRSRRCSPSSWPPTEPPGAAASCAGAADAHDEHDDAEDELGEAISLDTGTLQGRSHSRGLSPAGSGHEGPAAQAPAAAEGVAHLPSRLASDAPEDDEDPTKRDTDEADEEEDEEEQGAEWG
jgi:hypothetical protein